MKENRDFYQNEFLEKIKQHLADWQSKEVSSEEKFEGIIHFLLKTLDSEYYLSLADGPIISGTLEERYFNPLKTDEYNMEEQDEFLEHIENLKEYWGQMQKDYSEKYCLDGFVFSFLVTLDGNGSLPVYSLVKQPFDRKDEHLDITGDLHECFHIV